MSSSSFLHPGGKPPTAVAEEESRSNVAQQTVLSVDRAVDERGVHGIVLRVIALEGNGTPGVVVGTWDIEKYGKIARAYETALQRVKDDLAPDAKYIRIDNEQGQMVRFHPPVRGWAGPPQATTVPSATELRSTI